VTEDELDQAVDRLARRLATGPAHAYARAKALLTREQNMSLSAALQPGRGTSSRPPPEDWIAGNRQPK